jgi:glycosyltransferase involved in cell wall biosynthesis
MIGEPQMSFVLPAYNEGAAIEAALARILAYIDARGLDAEVVVANDGSRDDTETRARGCAERDHRVRVISHTPNRGKGYAVGRGMLEAKGVWRVFLDVDMATPVEETDRVLPLLEAGADVVIGSRHLPESVIEVPQGALRRFMGGVFRKIAGAMLGLGVSDVTCGFKAMTGEAADGLFAVQHEHGWAFDAELIYVARKWGLRLCEVPVRWSDSGQTTVRPFRAAWESWQELVRIRSRDRRGQYAAVSAVGES